MHGHDILSECRGPERVYDDRDPPTPNQSGRTGDRKVYMLRLEKETCGDCDSRARQPRRKGRRHRLNQDGQSVRRDRRNTHRQMDHIWLAEMGNGGFDENIVAVYLDYSRYEGFFPVAKGFWASDRAWQNAKRLLAVNGIDEAFADAHWAGYGDQDDLWNLVEWEDELNDRHWEFYSKYGWEEDPFWDRYEDDEDSFHDRWDDWFVPPEPLTAEEIRQIEQEEEAALEAYVPAQFGGPRGWRAERVSRAA